MSRPTVQDLQLPRPTHPASTRSSALYRAAGLLGSLMVAIGVLAIWRARLGVHSNVYVSQLGAPSMPTAEAFNNALLVLGLGGILAGVGCRGHRSEVRALRVWTVATTLVLTGGAFVLASRITCTDGCPVPFTSGSTLQDLLHVSLAGAGFGGAAWAMLQVATSSSPRAQRIGAMVAATGTGLAAAGGALLSILGSHTDKGALLEFGAMSVATAWLVTFSMWTVLRRT